MREPRLHSFHHCPELQAGKHDAVPAVAPMRNKDGHPARREVPTNIAIISARRPRSLRLRLSHIDAIFDAIENGRNVFRFQKIGPSGCRPAGGRGAAH